MAIKANAEIGKKIAEFRKPLEAQGYEVLSSTPAEFETLLRKDLAAMATTVQQADIRLD